MQIAKHCKESASSTSVVTGQLLGLPVGSCLEVTDCFPFPVGCRACHQAACCQVQHCACSRREPGPTARNANAFLLLRQQGNVDDEADATEGENYQLEMMRCLREINADNNMVGW